ncbi:hypothetical protein E4P35_13160 [Thiopseudomonas sp. 4R-3cl]|nr:hypothetical protein E4P35_13160 [Thiopseudomonas sp. 4R-3cl]
MLTTSKACAEDRGWRGVVARDVLAARRSARAAGLLDGEDVADCVADLVRVTRHLDAGGLLDRHSGDGTGPGAALRADAEAVRDQLGRELLDRIGAMCPGA